MGRYRKIDPRIWCDSKFASLDIHGQRLFLYILTCPEMTAVGAFRGTALNMAVELGYVKGFNEALSKGFPEVFSKAFSELLSKGLVKADEDGLLMFVPNFLKYNEPESPNVVKSWKSVIDYLPECPLLVEVVEKAIEAGKTKFLDKKQGNKKDSETAQEAVEQLENCLASLSKTFGKPSSKASGKASSKPSGKAMPNQEQEQEQDIYTPKPPQGAVCVSEADLPDMGAETANAEAKPARKTRKSSEERKAEREAKKAAERERFVADALKLNWYDVPAELATRWLVNRFDAGRTHFSQTTIDYNQREAAANGKTLAEAVEVVVANEWLGYKRSYEKSTSTSDESLERFKIKAPVKANDGELGFMEEPAEPDLAWLNEEAS